LIPAALLKAALAFLTFARIFLVVAVQTNGFWMLVVFGEVLVNRDLQVGDALEDAAPGTFAGDLGEETFDQVQPG
jgi:hypothetical protein